MRPLAITMGDPAGIGGEILVKAWREGMITAPVFAIDDPARLKALGVAIHEISEPGEALSAPKGALPVISEPLTAPQRPGVPEPRNAQAVIRSIERAVSYAREGAASGLVTLPVNKKALYDGADFSHPGHTEFLAALTGAPLPVMMIAAPGLRVVPVTIHIPISEIPAALSAELIIETGEILERSLRDDFGLQAPRIAVAGLNPHAGEGGAMGCEDIDIITPAIAALRAKGVDAAGPLPADTMFHPAARARYDAALCMYHDQALIPVKMLDFAHGVNVTLGLPVIRTSPDHGTGYDIAGTGAPDPSSFVAAVEMAARMAQNRGAK